MHGKKSVQMFTLLKVGTEWSDLFQVRLSQEI